jgi:molybdopterin converting factor small subunit|tara:strand:- start:157 stop:402 length:246 start_codon:yes stop_codon:yes gene_type:complete
MSLTTLEDYVKREIFKTDKELFDFCPACDETGNTVEALMKGLFQEAKKLQKERDEILKINRSIAKSIKKLKNVVNDIGSIV